MHLSAPLFGLAPGGVYLAIPITWDTGELLPHRFTLTLLRAVCFLLHFPYPGDTGTVVVNDHLALWSSDFPPVPNFLEPATI